jgi:hypothetical protein
VLVVVVLETTVVDVLVGGTVDDVVGARLVDVVLGATLVDVVLGATLVEVVLDTAVVDVVLATVVDVVLGPTVVEVVDTSGQSWKSMVQSGVHLRKAPVELPGQVAVPKSCPSHSSPGSITPLPQRSASVVEVEVEVVVEVVVGATLVEVVVDTTVVEVVEATVVEVVDTSGQSWKSMVQSGVHLRKAPVELPGQVAVPKSCPSHSSPGSITPLPQRSASVVEVVLVEVVVGATLVEVVVDTTVVEVVVDARVVVVVGRQSSGKHASWQFVNAPQTLLGG